MARRKRRKGPKNELSQTAAWVLAFFGGLGFTAISYLTLKSLQESFQLEIENRVEKMLKTHKTLSQRRQDRINFQKAKDEERKKKENIPKGDRD